MKSEREAKVISEHRIAQQKREAVADATAPVPADDIFASLSDSDEKELRLVIKADVRGTMEAIRESAEKLSTERVKVGVIRAGVGAVTESDVMLASASKAVVYGFHVRPERAARIVAETEGVEIRTFDIVYELLDDLVHAMEGLLPPLVIEKVSGQAEVRQLFVIPRRGTVAGCMLTEGPIRSSDRVRVVRDGVPIYTARIDSLRRFKEDVREVQAGLECGIRVENFNDVKVGDVLECFVVEERPDTL